MTSGTDLSIKVESQDHEISLNRRNRFKKLDSRSIHIHERKHTHTHTDFHPRLPTLHTAQSTLLGFLKTRKVPRNIIPILPLRPPGYTAATRRAACFPALQRDEGLRFFRLPLGLSLLLIYHFSFSPEKAGSLRDPFPGVHSCVITGIVWVCFRKIRVLHAQHPLLEVGNQMQSAGWIHVFHVHCS